MRGETAATASAAGGAAVPGMSAATTMPSPCKNLIEDIIGEQCDVEMAQQVEAEIAAYEKTAAKLTSAIEAGDLDLGKLLNGDDGCRAPPKSKQKH